MLRDSGPRQSRFNRLRLPVAVVTAMLGVSALSACGGSEADSAGSSEVKKSSVPNEGVRVDFYEAFQRQASETDTQEIDAFSEEGGISPIFTNDDGLPQVDFIADTEGRRDDIECGEIEGDKLGETAWTAASGEPAASCIAPKDVETKESRQAMEKAFNVESEEPAPYE